MGAIALGTVIVATAVIPISGTTSAPITTNGSSLCGVLLPATFTGTSISFLACNTVGGTYVPVYNSSGQVTYTVAANRYVAINPQDFYGVQFLEIVSNATEAAARTLACAMKGI